MGNLSKKFTKLHLLHEKTCVHGGISLIQRKPFQLQQVARASQRRFEKPIALVDACGLLHGEPALLVGGVGVTIRVQGTLEIAIAQGQHFTVHIEADGESEKLEVVAGEIHG
jgi:hypothetical protein